MIAASEQVHASDGPAPVARARAGEAPLGRDSSVLALVPHFRCEEWLGDCLESLLTQTRPLQGIVVIDDASPEPPVEILRRFRGVTLLATSENAGPYALVQGVIDRTRCDAYLFADADDWSAPCRLAHLLEEAEATGAELVGSQEVRIRLDAAEALLVRYPPDVTAALRERPGSFALLHPTSLVARDLVVRIGGFATGLRFGGDLEFVERAGHVARIVNAPAFCYLRRERAGALTSDGETGLRSPARLQLHSVLRERAEANAERRAVGVPPRLEPLRVRRPVPLSHLSGPVLSHEHRPPPPTRGMSHRDRRRRVGEEVRMAAPVFILGAPRSAASLLARALGEHPDLLPLPETPWFRDAVHRLAHRATGRGAAPGSAEPAAGDPAAGQPPVEDVWRLLNRAEREARAAAGEGDARNRASGARRLVYVTPGEMATKVALLRLFPDARWIHVVRGVGNVVRSLTQVAVPDSTYHTSGTALAEWSRAEREARSLERALGSSRLLRVKYSSLLSSPRTELGKCLAFIGVDFREACVRPFRGASPDGSEALVAGAAARGALAGSSRVERLSQLLLEGSSEYPGSERRRERLERSWLSVDRGPPPAELDPLSRLREFVRTVVPPAGTVLVVSRGDPELLRLGNVRAWHFPRASSGEYAGYHPADSAEAIAHLEALRQLGGEFLLLPCTGFWWLEAYGEFRAHLESRYPVLADSEGLCRIFALHPASEPGAVIRSGGGRLPEPAF